MDTRMRKTLFALLFLASPVSAQTQTQYYTVPTIAALKAMTTSRPAVVQVADANPGVFNLSSGACSAADDIFQVQPTAGTTVCYTRMATPYSVGKSATVNGVLVTNGTGVPSVSTTLPAFTLSGALTYGGITLSNSVTGTGSMVLSASPTFTGTLTAATGVFSATVNTGGYTVATLPVAPGTGARAYVTDQLTTCAVTGVALTGGGVLTCPVFYNGAAWVGG